MLDGLLHRGAPRRLKGRERRVYERVSATLGAPVVVLVHGVGVSGRFRLPTAGRLAGRCSVYVPDLLRHARSLVRHVGRLVEAPGAAQAVNSAAPAELARLIACNSADCVQ